MMIRFVTCIALLLAGLLPVAAAADPVTVRSGATEILATVPSDFEITTQGTKGVGKKLPTTPPGSFKLEYTANTTDKVLTDQVVYKTAAGAVQTIDIKIDPGPPAPGFGSEVFGQAGRAVFYLFVVAVILESALALLFNWKPFVENLVPRAVRPVIAFFAAILVVNLLGMDVVAALANALDGTKHEVTTTGQIITAMVIAGGSAGVNTMLIALGFRSVRTPATEPKPPPDRAWLALRALDGKSRGDLFVYLTSPPGGANALLGVIKGRSKPASILSWFLSDRGRLPNYGGHTVLPGHDYVIQVRGTDENGVPLPPATYGPLQFARGAVVDIDVKL
jgi:hypothetical protein